MDDKSDINMDRLKASADALGDVYNSDVVSKYMENHHTHFKIGKEHVEEMLDGVIESIKKHFGVEDEKD